MSDQRAGLTEAEIAEAIREPMTIHLLSAADIVGTIATLRAELAADRRAVMDALGGGITDASLKERILALRAERDEYRAELAARTNALKFIRDRAANVTRAVEESGQPSPRIMALDDIAQTAADALGAP